MLAGSHSALLPLQDGESILELAGAFPENGALFHVHSKRISFQQTSTIAHVQADAPARATTFRLTMNA